LRANDGSLLFPVSIGVNVDLIFEDPWRLHS
jgi:hypothetical protein